MIDIKLLREDPEKIKKSAEDKGLQIDISQITDLDRKVRALETKTQELREERNKIAREKDIEKGKKIKQELEKFEKDLNKEKESLRKLLLEIPNLPKPDVKVGKDESENEIIRKFKEPTKFSFTPKDHLEIGEKLDIIDMERGSKVSGPRFAYRKGDAVLLELALTKYAFDFLIKEGFVPVIPPVLIKREIMQGLGYMENGGEEDMFALKDNDLFLVGTAEQSLVPMHKDEILNIKDLPLRYVGYSASFRREAGSYGRDTRGIFRNHQFNKVEMVSFVPAGEDDKEQEYLLSLEEKLFQSLDIPYQVVKMCTGDLGFPAARKFDLEAWIPSQNRYREVTSVSTVTDFQSRRLNMKYQNGADKKYLNVLNGTAFAMSRTPIAILENYQQKDGSIIIPKVLQKYIGKTAIKPKN